MVDVVDNEKCILIYDKKELILKYKWSQDQKALLSDKYKSSQCSLVVIFQNECTNIHSFKCVKKIWDKLTITYEDYKEVKRNNLGISNHQYKLFSMEENESIQSMFCKC